MHAPDLNSRDAGTATDVPADGPTLDYPSQLIALTDDRIWLAYGEFAGAARRLAERDPVTDELVRIQNAAVQSCHY